MLRCTKTIRNRRDGACDNNERRWASWQPHPKELATNWAEKREFAHSQRIFMAPIRFG
jgi:hypothetical protein